MQILKFVVIGPVFTNFKTSWQFQIIEMITMLFVCYFSVYRKSIKCEMYSASKKNCLLVFSRILYFSAVLFIDMLFTVYNKYLVLKMLEILL